MTRIQKRYTKEEKLQIVELSLADDVSVAELATRFGVHANSIYRWRAQFTAQAERAFPGSGRQILTEEEQEVETLKKQLREKTLEVEILKKAVGIFSSPNRKDLLS